MPTTNVVRRRRLWTIAAAAALWLLAAGWTAAAAAPSAETGPGWPQQGSDIEPDPQVVYGTLPNGFRYALMPNRRPSDRVSLHLNVQAGSLHEDDDQEGIAHFLEHMMFNGTEHFDAGELVKFFQRIGMQFGPDANAHTSFDETVYDILLPDGSVENLQEGLRILKDYAEGALLQPEEIDRERRVILAEKRSRDSGGYRTFVAEMGFRFPGSLLSRRMPIGTEEDIRAADRERMKEYYDRWYRPETMMLVAVGDFEPQGLARRVEEMFSTVAARLPAAAEPLLEPVAHSGVSPFHHYEKEAGSTSVSIEVARIRPPVTDSRAFRRTQLLRSLAHRMIQHRLDRRMRESDSPFTSARWSRPRSAPSASRAAGRIHSPSSNRRCGRRWSTDFFPPSWNASGGKSSPSSRRPSTRPPPGKAETSRDRSSGT